MSEKPTIFLIHGAWHTIACYEKLIPYLNEAGFSTCTVQLPSSMTAQTSNSGDDVIAIRSKLSELVNNGKEVILFMHSYAGFPGSEAVHKLSLTYRKAQDLAGGVTHLIYCTAMIAAAGDPLIPNKDALFASVILSDEGRTCLPTETEERFYGDLDMVEKEKYAVSLRWQSMAAFDGVSSYSAYKDVESTYIYCELDQALPITYQRYLVDSLGRQYFNEVSLASSHSPFLSMPEKVVEIIEETWKTSS